MRRLACWTVVALALALTNCAAAWAASASSPPQTSNSAMKDFQQDLTLGSELMERQGTSEQLGALQKLFTRGAKDAREAVAKNPKSPEAQYMLGSWLLYGYRVVMSKRITQSKGEEHVDEVPRVVQGLSSDESEGLNAMKRAQDLAPRNGHYIVEYGAALIHANRSPDASGVLKKVWAGDAQVSPQDKVRAAMLLSDLAANRGDASGARGWLYRALAENRDNIGIVERLRKLDLRQAQAAVAAPAESGEDESAVTEDTSGDQSVAPDESSDEGVTSDEQAPGEEGVVIEAPESDNTPAASDESSAGTSDEGSQAPSEDESAPATSDQDSGD